MTKKEIIVLLQDKYELAEFIDELEISWDELLHNDLEDIVTDRMNDVLSMLEIEDYG